MYDWSTLVYQLLFDHPWLSVYDNPENIEIVDPDGEIVLSFCKDYIPTKLLNEITSAIFAADMDLEGI